MHYPKHSIYLYVKQFEYKLYKTFLIKAWISHKILFIACNMDMVIIQDNVIIILL